MDQRATGIILRKWPLTETSLILNWLTPQFGRISTVAKGSFRAKSPFQGKLDLFHLAEFSFSRSRKSDLHLLKEVKLLDPNLHLRQNLSALRQASWFALLLEKTTEKETPLPELFELLNEFLSALKFSPPAAAMVCAFEMKLLSELGLAPAVKRDSFSPECLSLLEQLLERKPSRICELIPSQSAQEELSRFLGRFLEFEFGQLPALRQVALALPAVNIHTGNGS
jgi:DNA repair protein RecO (recombination protein O)